MTRNSYFYPVCTAQQNVHPGKIRRGGASPTPGKVHCAKKGVHYAQVSSVKAALSRLARAHSSQVFTKEAGTIVTL